MVPYGSSLKLLSNYVLGTHHPMKASMFCDTFILLPSDFFFFFYFACTHKNYSQKIFICMWKA